jgi:hypothetical protein
VGVLMAGPAVELEEDFQRSPAQRLGLLLARRR